MLTLPSLPIKDYLIGGAVIGVIVFTIAEYKHIEEQGAAKVLSHQVDSAKKVFDTHVKADTQAFASATQQADKDRAALLIQLARSKAVAAHADTMARQASDERDEARHILSDSLATVAQLRTSLVGVLRTAVADSVASSRQHEADAGAITALMGTVRADSVALRAGRLAVNSLTADLLASQRQTQLAKAQIPSFVAQHLSVGAGYGAVLNGGRVLGGATVAATVRIWP